MANISKLANMYITTLLTITSIWLRSLSWIHLHGSLNLHRHICKLQIPEQMYEISILKYFTETAIPALYIIQTENRERIWICLWELPTCNRWTSESYLCGLFIWTLVFTAQYSHTAIAYINPHQPTHKCANNVWPAITTITKQKEKPLAAKATQADMAV